MRIESSLHQHLARRELFALAFNIMLMQGLKSPAAYANSPSGDVPPPVESIVPLITGPIESRVPEGKTWGLQRIEQPLIIPEATETLLRFSIVAEFPESPSGTQGAGLFIENGLQVGDPNFTRTLFARISDQNEDIWGIGQLINGKIVRVAPIAPGSRTMDFEVNPSRSGNEGTVMANGEGPLPFMLRHPLSNTDRMTFAAYSEGQTVTRITALEAIFKTP